MMSQHLGYKEHEKSIPILTYHSIDNSGSVISISPDRFKSHMEYLCNSSFNVISLNEIVASIHENRLFPSKSIAITFDDGFKNNYDIAYPLLKEFGFKATIFLVTGYCGKNNQWNGQPEEIPTLELLKWDDIIEMANNGIDFGAHTINHPNLTELTKDQVKDEILGSKRMLNERLGKDIPFFSYPYGWQTDEILKFVEGEFSCAVSTELKVVDLESDVYALPRIDMFYFSRNNYFSWLGTSKFSRYIKLRHVLRSLRKS